MTGIRRPDQNGAFFRHIEDAHLNPHPQYRLEAEQIDTADIANDAITAAKIAPDAVGTSEIAADAVGTSEIANDAVTAAKIVAGAVGTSEMADGSITQAKCSGTHRLFHICTSGTIPVSLAEGDMYYETDTNRMWQVSGAWAEFIAGRPPHVHAYRSSAQILSTGVASAITLGSELYDTDSLHSTSVNTHRLTVPSQRAGLWQVFYQGSYAGNSSGTRASWIEVNGAGRYAMNESHPVLAGNGIVHTGMVNLVLAAGDYVHLIQYQSSGGDLNGFGSNSTDYFGMTYVGWGP